MNRTPEADRSTGLRRLSAYVDSTTGERYPLGQPRWRSDCGNLLSIEPLPGISRDEIATRTRSLWRYAAALPLAVAKPISLGEGCTPLVDTVFRGTRVLFKLEWFAPTGSFKDRGASVMISVLREQGVESLVCDSSGNAGASIAAYAAVAGMRAKIIACADTPATKVAQIRAYGARVQLVRGNREAAAAEALRQAAQCFLASHAWHPLFLQGTKTVAYEIWEDLGFRAPDNLVVPTGSGGNLIGCYLGFQELLRRREIQSMPRLFAVQPALCAPIHASYEAGADDLLTHAPVAPSIADGANVGRPLRARDVLAALRATGGSSVTVTEQRIVQATHDLAKAGLFVEPTSAMAAAALDTLLHERAIGPEQKTVVLLTSSGLKGTRDSSAS